MKIQQLIPLIVLSVALTACAGGPKVKMDDDIRKSIRTVAIDSDVEVPKKVHFNSNTQNVTASFGLLGMFIGDSHKKEKTAALKNAMQKQGIDVSDMVYKKFTREMAQRTPYKPLKKGAKSDATMSIDVHLYGLEAGGSGGRMYPQITVSAVMKNDAGKTIWANNGTVGPLQKKNQAKYTFDQLIAQPARLEEIMSSAAGLVANKVMAEL